VFVLNFSDLKKPNTCEAAGTRAKGITKDLLKKMGIF
jgi:hypothetical protein